MPPDDALRRDLEAIRDAAIRALARLARDTDAPVALRDGLIGSDDLIWIDGHWFRLTPRIRRLLSFTMGGGSGKSWRAIAKYMPLSGGKQSVKSRLWEANKKIREEAIDRRLMRWPRFGLDGEERLTWGWTSTDIQKVSLTEK